MVWHKTRLARTPIVLFLALVLTGVATGLPTTTPASQGGMAGTAVGCDLSGSGFLFAYGEAGVPQSGGSGDGACDDWSARFEGEVRYTVVKNTQGNGYASAWWYDPVTFTYTERFVNCGQPATVLVDWTTTPPSATYVSGAGCFLYAEGDIAARPWAAYGGGTGGLKFAHTDNLVDALAQLLT
jgi:hypothetical protein